MYYKRLSNSVHGAPLYCTNTIQNTDDSICGVFNDNEQDKQMNTNHYEDDCIVESINANVHNNEKQRNVGDRLEQPLSHHELSAMASNWLNTICSLLIGQRCLQELFIASLGPVKTSLYVFKYG